MTERADVLIHKLGLAKSRTNAALLISQSLVTADGKTVKKPSEMICETAVIEIKEGACPYVSRGGLKLEEAICKFGIDVSGVVAVDIGASTGGFTDCLLKHGAKKVYAVDVGVGQLDGKIKDNPSVVSMEKTNARTLEKSSIPEQAELVVMDVSFISQALIYPAVSRLLNEGGLFVSLVKPQFELGKNAVGRGGIVKNADEKIKGLIKQLEETANIYGLKLVSTVKSPIKGGDGNVEYLALFRRDKVEL